MKNIIKIASSALVATLVLGTVAFAAPGTGNGGSTTPNSPSNGNGGSTSGNSVPSSSNTGGSTAGNPVPSTGNGGTTSGNPTTPSDGGTSSNESSRKHRSSGGSYRKNIALTNVKVNVVGNKATVTWDTNPMAQGMLVYGPLSLAVPTAATSFYGYAAGTPLTGATASHSHTFTLAPNVTYFVRPVAIVGGRVVFASEIKINKTTGTTISKTAAPAAGTVFDAPTKKPVIESKIPADVEVSKSPKDTNVANIKDATPSKTGRFFKKIWNSITSPFCN